MFWAKHLKHVFYSLISNQVVCRGQFGPPIYFPLSLAHYIINLLAPNFDKAIENQRLNGYDFFINNFESESFFKKSF